MPNWAILEEQPEVWQLTGFARLNKICNSDPEHYGGLSGVVKATFDVKAYDEALKDSSMTVAALMTTSTRQDADVQHKSNAGTAPVWVTLPDPKLVLNGTGMAMYARMSESPEVTHEEALARVTQRFALKEQLGCLVSVQLR